MILLTSLVIKLLFLLTCGFVIWKYFKNLMTKTMMAFIGILLLSAAILANALSSVTPPIRDQVILTAQDKSRDDAKSTEIYLEGFTIDGKRVYIAYPHGSVPAWIETLLAEEGFKLDTKNQTVKVNTYVRK